jgi:hypothetical protein
VGQTAPVIFLRMLPVDIFARTPSDDHYLYAGKIIELGARLQSNDRNPNTPRGLLGQPIVAWCRAVKWERDRSSFRLYKLFMAVMINYTYLRYLRCRVELLRAKELVKMSG